MDGHQTGNMGLMHSFRPKLMFMKAGLRDAGG
jgi:hypothetical protein